MFVAAQRLLSEGRGDIYYEGDTHGSNLRLKLQNVKNTASDTSTCRQM